MEISFPISLNCTILCIGKFEIERKIMSLKNLAILVKFQGLTFHDPTIVSQLLSVVVKATHFFYHDLDRYFRYDGKIVQDKELVFNDES